MTLTTPDVVSENSDRGRQGVDYFALNAQLNIWGFNTDGSKRIQFEKDREAARVFFREHVNPNTVYFSSLEDKLEFLVREKYYEAEFLAKYDLNFIKKLYKKLYDYKFRFATFMGAYKYYTSYTLKTFDGQRYLERFEDRVAAAALYLGDGDKKLAENLALEIIEGRFQPATPTFLNAGKAQRGELVSCFLMDIGDNLNEIGRAVNSALQLSKRGGGVALNLSNLRESGAPIKKIENQSSGVIPVMKILEDSFKYANQLGARQGAGAVYIHAHHPDIMEVLDTKRENADEAVRIKALSIGVVIPDITFELARNNEPMYLFSPYDVERIYGTPFSYISVTDKYREMVDNPDIRKKKIDARKFLSTLAELQMESGYPYIMFEDAVNRANNIDGKILMSNLCSEILQVQQPSHLNDDQSYGVLGKDISCNLGSLNVRKTLQSQDFGKTIETAIRTLTNVSDMSDISSVPTIASGNKRSHAVGLGAMNLHGAFGFYHMNYGDKESLDLTNMYFYTVTYHAIRTSMLLAKERKETFDGFERSKYASGEYFERYINATDDVYSFKTDKVKKIFKENNITVPTAEDWEELAKSVKKYGMFNQNLQAVPPTGSISYVTSSTASIHPITSVVESRKEGKIGTTQYVPEDLTNETMPYFQDAYEVGFEKLIDIYSVVTHYVDQGNSLTLFMKDNSTTRDINRAQLYAFAKGKPSKKEPTERSEALSLFPQAEIKTIYYIRLQAQLVSGQGMEECVSCAL